MNLSLERRYADAEKEHSKALQTAPDHPMALSNLWDVLQLLGRYDEAVAMLRRNFAGDQGAQDALTRGLGEGGYRAGLRRLAMYLGPRPPSSTFTWFSVAALYALAGERDSTFAWLERAYQAHDGNLPYLDQPDFDAVRDDPRFRDLCRRMNLTTCAQGEHGGLDGHDRP